MSEEEFIKINTCLCYQMSIKTRRLGSEVPTDGWGEIINSPLSIIHFLNEKVKHTYCRNYRTFALNVQVDADPLMFMLSHVS